MADTVGHQASVAAARRTPSDVEDFVGLATALDSGAWPSLRGFLVSYYPLLITRAPGSLAVLEARRRATPWPSLNLPLAEAALVAVQRADDRMLAVAQLPDRADDAPQVHVITMGELEELAARPYAELRARFAGHSWMAAVAGSLVALHRELGRWIGESWRVLIRSHIPASGDFGSLAALEVAVVQALVSLLDEPLEGRELARLCRVVETEVLGVPCTGAAQWTAALGRQDHLLAIDADDVAFVPLPPSVRLWGLTVANATGAAHRPPPSGAVVLAAAEAPAEGGVERFCRLLGGVLDEAVWCELAQIMNAPDESDSARGYCSAEADLLVQRLRSAGPERWVYGARIVGLRGATITVLGRSDAEPAVREIAERGAAECGLSVRIVSGSSPGACEFDCVRR